ncbi:MAG: hypothetical protein PHQ11_04675 [Paludibacter sp.]|nr:hypothetical protein [Paludibacter sp.]
MKYRTLAVAMTFLLLFAFVASAADNTTTEKKLISLDEASGKSRDLPGEKQTISLEEARARNNNTNVSSDEYPQIEMGTERMEDEDFIRNEVSAGNSLFLRSLVDGLYDTFRDSREKTDAGITNGLIFTAVTFVPNPYDDPMITDLYGGYTGIALYLIVIFIFGELISRSISRTKLTSSIIRVRDLSEYRFVGGVLLCGFALFANFVYVGVLEVIEVLNQYITLPALPDMTPGYDSLTLYLMMGIVDLVVMIFFVVRYLVMYAFAVICSVVAVMLVPEPTRDFALDIVEKMIRLLAMQPATLFVTAMGIISFQSMPGPIQPFAYLGLGVLIFMTCWYCYFGKFTLLKKAAVFAIRKGVTKV